MRGWKCLADKSVSCSKLNVILKVHFQIHLCNVEFSAWNIGTWCFLVFIQTSSTLTCFYVHSKCCKIFMKHMGLCIRRCCTPEYLCVQKEVLLSRTRTCKIENPEMFSFHERLPWVCLGLIAFWLLKINSTLLIFYLIYSAQAFLHQARVLILSQSKSVSFFSAMLNPHQQQREKQNKTQ